VPSRRKLLLPQPSPTAISPPLLVIGQPPSLGQQHQRHNYSDASKVPMLLGWKLNLALVLLHLQRFYLPFSTIQKMKCHLAAMRTLENWLASGWWTKALGLKLLCEKKSNGWGYLLFMNSLSDQFIGCCLLSVTLNCSFPLLQIQLMAIKTLTW
jgi:hypothetical protein